MKIYYDNQVNEVKDFIKKIRSNLTDDQIIKIIESEELKKFLVANESTLVWNEDLKNSNRDIKSAIDDIAKINIDSEDGDAEFAAYFVGIFKILEKRQPQVNQQGQNQQPQQQNQQNPQVAEQLLENLKKKYNFSISLGVNPAEKIKRFKVVNKANGGADGGDEIFTDELGKALYCTSNGNALHLDTTALKANLENKKVQEAWWGILSDLGFYWDNEIKITNPSEKGQNNADTIGKQGLNRTAIQQKLKEEEEEKIAQAIRVPPPVDLKKNDTDSNNEIIEKPLEVDDKISDINKINFDDIEISKKTFTFDVKKYGSLFEIVAEDTNGGSYRFQLDKFLANEGISYKEIYDSIKSKDDVYNFKADDEIQTILNKLLRANNIQKWNFFNNDVKKDAIINQDAKAYSYSYYRYKNKNTDINFNFGFLQQDIKNKNDFEKLIYEQGFESEFFVKVDDTNNDEKYVKFSLYWDEDEGKPAIHLAKSLNGKNIKLYGSNQELCGSVAKNNANFKNIEVSFQLYYNRGKTIFQNDDNKALYFIDNTKIIDFCESSKASDLELNSSIVTDKKATKEITAKERELTQEEKTVEIEKINQALEKELKNAFPEQNGVVNPLIASINAFVKGDKDSVMPNEIQSEPDKLAVNQLKEKYQAKMDMIDKAPSHKVNNPQVNQNQQKQYQQNQQI